jgi:glycosyltransferase involved in cell wall biosynthesis
VLLSDYPNDARARRAAEAMAVEGMIVEMVCLKRNRAERMRDRHNGVEILRIPTRHRRGGKVAYLFHYLSFLLAAFTVVSVRSLTRRYDVVHVHNMPDVLVFAALVPRLFGAKVVLDLHDPMPELMRTIFGMEESGAAVRLLKALEKISISFAHAVITVNKTCRTIFSSRSCSADKVSVVMNAPDEDVFVFRPPRPGRRVDDGKPFVVMFHGALVERNGLALAIEAISKVRTTEPRVELKIYGDRTPHLDTVLESAYASGYEGWIHYMGPKTLEQIVPAMDECDLGVIPNLRSIFTEINTPTRIFEFLSRGTPVITPLAPGVLEFFDHDTLVTFRLGDAADLARQIEFVMHHPDEVVEITRRGQQVCYAHRWTEERQTFLAVIRRLLNADAVPEPVSAP